MIGVSESQAEVIVASLADQGVRTVVIGGSDTHGVMRGKRIPLEFLASALTHGLPLCDVFWVMHVDESELVPRPEGHTGYFPTERQGYPDIVGVPDASTLRRVPWHDATAAFLVDWHLPHGGGPVPIDPRGVLRRVVDRAQAMGFTPMSALELEFYLLREPTASPHPKRAADLVPLWEQPSTYGVVLGSHQEHIGALIRDRMAEYGLPIEACNPETGPGQFEINLRYGPSVTAADHAFLFKSAVKEVAAEQGLLATFMAKPNSEWAGNSCHVHMSLRDSDGVGVFADESGAMSPLMHHFVGGILATMPEFSALMAPNPNSYRRYSAYSWSGTTATWGVDNRSTGVRAIVEGTQGTRIEHRQPGGDVNPYIATAVVLAAGLHGIEHGIEPPSAMDTDVYALPSGTVPRLPTSLNDSVKLLADSAIAREWLGHDFVEHFLELKRAELEAQRTYVTDWEVARYLEAL